MAATDDFTGKLRCRFDPKEPLNLTDLSHAFTMDCYTVGAPFWVAMAWIGGIVGGLAALYGLQLCAAAIKHKIEDRRHRLREAAANDFPPDVEAQLQAQQAQPQPTKKHKQKQKQGRGAKV